MSVHSRHSDWVYATALSWKAVAQRFSFVLFVGLSLGLLFIGHSKPYVVQMVRARMVDVIAPALDVMSRPLELVGTIELRIHSYRELMRENARLKAENADLLRWQNAALTLKEENKELRSLLNYKNEPGFAFISARVIADTGGAFARSLVVTAGRDDGVREGMAAMTGEGLIGRVVEVGDWTSRLLLITDLNSRIPVMVTGTGDHAILAGDNMPEPKLLYLPQESEVKVGARVVTSGHGGIFPPNLPVGVVSSSNHTSVEVAPIAPLGQINQVRLVDFNLAGGTLNPETVKVQPASPAAR